MRVRPWPWRGYALGLALGAVAAAPAGFTPTITSITPLPTYPSCSRVRAAPR
jgi:hypothetical protein